MNNQIRHPGSRTHRAFVFVFIALTGTCLLKAETTDYLEEDPYQQRMAPQSPPSNPPPAQPARARRATSPQTPERAPGTQPTRPEPRKYFTNDEPRTDAGVFHVGFAVGGNFYIEPDVVPITLIPTGDFHKDFGFQLGVYMDHDYSELDENIPLMLRGMVGYKYVLSSIHVFAFDGMVRRMFRFSDNASFGVGLGASAAVWFRAPTEGNPEEQMILIPSMLIGAGFEFNPFMVDFKWAINRFGADDTIMGFELYFGFRL